MDKDARPALMLRIRRHANEMPLEATDVVNFGEQAGETYGAILIDHARYSQWIVNESVANSDEASDSLKRLARFLTAHGINPTVRSRVTIKKTKPEEKLQGHGLWLPPPRRRRPRTGPTCPTGSSRG